MNIKTTLIPITFLLIEHGYANGYVGVPPGHPWFGKDYCSIDVSIHGGLTFSEDHCPNQQPDGYWWVGFDTIHYQDNKFTCDKTYCENEVASLKKQAEEAIKS